MCPSPVGSKPGGGGHSRLSSCRLSSIRVASSSPLPTFPSHTGPSGPNAPTTSERTGPPCFRCRVPKTTQLSRGRILIFSQSSLRSPMRYGLWRRLATIPSILRSRIAVKKRRPSPTTSGFAKIRPPEPGTRALKARRRSTSGAAVSRLPSRWSRSKATNHAGAFVAARRIAVSDRSRLRSMTSGKLERSPSMTTISPSITPAPGSSERAAASSGNCRVWSRRLRAWSRSTGPKNAIERRPSHLASKR